MPTDLAKVIYRLHKIKKTSTYIQPLFTRFTDSMHKSYSWQRMSRNICICCVHTISLPPILYCVHTVPCLCHPYYCVHTISAIHITVFILSLPSILLCSYYLCHPYYCVHTISAIHITVFILPLPSILLCSYYLCHPYCVLSCTGCSV